MSLEMAITMNSRERFIATLRAYPNNPEQRNVIMAQTK